MGKRSCSSKTRIHLTFFLSHVSQPILISRDIREYQHHASIADSTGGKLRLWLWRDRWVDWVTGRLRIARDWRGTLEVRHQERFCGQERNGPLFSWFSLVVSWGIDNSILAGVRWSVPAGFKGWTLPNHPIAAANWVTGWGWSMRKSPAIRDWGYSSVRVRVRVENHRI